MKKFLTVLCSILIIISTLVFTNVTVGKQTLNHSSDFFDLTTIVPVTTTTLVSEPIMKTVPVEYRTQVENVIAVAEKDPRFKELVDEGALMALNDLQNGTNSMDDTEFAKKIDELAQAYAKEISVATGNTVTEEQIMTAYETIEVGENIKTVYQTTLNEVEVALTPQQQNFLNKIATFNQHKDTLQIVSFMVLAVSLILLFILNGRYVSKPLMIISIILLVLLGINRFAYSFGLDIIASKLRVKAGSVTLALTPYFISLGCIFTVFILSLFAYRKDRRK